MWLVLNGNFCVSSAISFLSVLAAVVSSMEGSTLSVCCRVAVSGIVVILVGGTVVVFVGVIIGVFLGVIIGVFLGVIIGVFLGGVVVVFMGSIVVVFMGSIVVVSDILLTTAAPCAVSTLTDSVVVASACPSPESKVLSNFCRSVM